ncbi:GDSL esterase/lipase 1-like [Pistacia vera]|uniref:GDSL esterase/lipase 1-like n=1 Tax=Pistacia vera TaxID=55513 RepID=UPI001263C93B|nr:GDSL esterase/lipase 1-like [Pistacia vera]
MTIDDVKAWSCKTKALFVFGDSLFDPGNNQYLNDSRKGIATTFPYGETYFKRPTGRLSDGRTVPDLIAQFSNLPILAPYLQPGPHQLTDGANFASAGAGVLDETHPGTIRLRLQLSYFKDVAKSLKQKLGEAEANRVLRNAVYLFSIGGNDYFSFSQTNPRASQSSKGQYVKTVIGNLTSVLKEIYNIGGGKIAFQNAGPLGCLPGMKSFDPKLGSACSEEPSSLARLHNRYLAVVLKKLSTQLPGFKYAIFDYYNALGDRVAKEQHPYLPQMKVGFLRGLFGPTMTFFEKPTGRISDGLYSLTSLPNAKLRLPVPYLEEGVFIIDGSTLLQPGQVFLARVRRRLQGRKCCMLWQWILNGENAVVLRNLSIYAKM